MKRSGYAASVLVVLAVVCAPGTGQALTLDEGECPYVAEFDNLGTSAANLILMIWGDEYGLWPEWDTEYDSGGAHGDGVLDSWQMTLLAAVLCADPGVSDPNVDLELIRQQYQANVVVSQTFGAQLMTVAPIAEQLGQFAWDIGNGLFDELPTAELNTVVNVPEEGDNLGNLATFLRRIGDDILVVVGFMDFGTFVSMYDLFTPWTAGLAGIDSGLHEYIDVILLDRLTGVASLVANAQLFEDLADMYQGTISAQLEQDLRDFAALLPQATLTMPEFELFGVGEPFAGASDWNNDGVTNLEVFDLVQGVGGTREDFVAAVTREEPILSHPQDIRRYVGESAQFTAAILNGFPPVEYQWYFDGAKGIIPSATDSTLTLSPCLPTDTGGYSCVVTDLIGSYGSNTATLAVASSLVIDEQPQGAIVNWSDSYTLEVTVSGGFPPLIYQWYKNSAPMPGATNASYTFGFLLFWDSATYTVEVSDDNTSVLLSNTAELVVTDEALPVAGGAVILGLIAGAFVLGGVLAVRRGR